MPNPANKNVLYFSKCFKLDVKKEILPYKYYNECGIKNVDNVDNMLKYVDQSDHAEFLDNAKKWGVIDEDGDILPLLYSAEYCKMDCLTLMKGYQTFRKWMIEITKYNIDDIMTIASLSHRFMIDQGVFVGVKELSGVPQLFIQKCVVGGRCMPANNKKKIYNNAKNKK